MDPYSYELLSYENMINLVIRLIPKSLSSLELFPLSLSSKCHSIFDDRTKLILLISNMIIIKTSSYDNHNDTNDASGEANDETKVGNRG